MRVEILAVGTELLLGQIADTNGQWLGQQLAAAGVDSHFHQAVGDNHRRIVTALRTALARGDAVICCGGLGPTQDDITRDAIAEVMNVPLVRDEEIGRRIEGFFAARGRTMPRSNLRQADVPQGARVIDQARGTAPGLICPVGHKVVYALPGVPDEMVEMFERAVLPDLRARVAEVGEGGVILSRVLRTWGVSESALAEALQVRIDALDVPPSAGGPVGTVTLAFLASGIEGMKVRLTARARDAEGATALLDAEEQEVRAVVGAAFGDIVFGVDDVSMEQAVGSLLCKRGLTLGVAESLTGGLVAARLVDVPGASAWFRGAVVAYDSAVKFSVLGVPEGPVVTEDAAVAMATGARRVLGASIGLGITGVAGPEPQEDLPPGTVFVALALPGGATPARRLKLPGDRQRVRQFAVISALDLLRRTLLTPDHGFGGPTLG
ncbi:MAG TPA: competence/damage-inducible protein A [Acidimicrobiales bacterium]|nr:competence/damage-inducible protein A [Acidimicrobiales bacterium]